MFGRMEFDRKWREWIKEYLSSASVSVLRNGSPTNEFSVSRGIRQGDPSAQFLFLIVVEGLSEVLKMVDRGLL